MKLSEIYGHAIFGVINDRDSYQDYPSVFLDVLSELVCQRENAMMQESQEEVQV